MSPHRLAAAALLLFTAIAASACNDDTDDGPIGQDADVSEGAGAIERVADAARATIDQEGAAFTIEVDPGGAAEGTAVLSAAAREMTVTGPDDDVYLVVTGGTVFAQLDDDTWESFAMSQLIEEVAAQPDAALLVAPNEYLRLISSDGVAEASADGSEQIDGDETDRYDLVVSSEGTNGRDEAFDAIAEEGLLDSIRMTVWIDRDELVRRVEYELAEGAVVTVEFRDLGDDAIVSRPRADTTPPGDPADLRARLGLAP